MRRIYLILFFTMIYLYDISGQRDSSRYKSSFIGRNITIGINTYRELTKDSICSDNPIWVDRMFLDPNDIMPTDSSEVFLATYCDKVTKIGFRYDFGFSQYIYPNLVADWLGNHQGTSLLDLTIIYDKLNFGFRFKPWTTNPISEIVIDNKVLTKDADVNPFKFDFFIGYDISLGEKYSIEPSLGYTVCTFKVNNEDKINQQFNFNSTAGLLGGLTFNKYIRVSTFKYVLFFGRFNYGFVDYSKIHKDFGNGYIEICAGISYKFYWTNRKYHIIK